ncbi:MAG: hypothetical protein MJZ21_03640 [archaeon]|nr:hypothetical protein [archaeon]
MAEICLDDIDGDVLTVTGKGHGCYGKRAEVDIPPETRELLNEYLEYRRP